MSLYPFGYAGSPQGMGTMLTWGQYLTKQTVWRLHPEFLRRVKALMEAAAAAGIPLGIGGGWRVQPNPPPPGFARPGNSNHEGFPIGPDSTGAVAADMVPKPSWPWMEANVARFGLRTFKYVNSEPWHIQPAEIPANRNWRTQPWDLAEFPLPGDVAPPPPPDPPQEDDMVLVRWQCTDADAAFFGWGTVDGVCQSVEWCNQEADAIYDQHFKRRLFTSSSGLQNLTFVGDLAALNAAETRKEWTEASFRLVVPAS